jgi:hypothetical protein
MRSSHNMVYYNQTNTPAIQAEIKSKTFFKKFLLILASLIFALSFANSSSIAYAATAAETVNQCNDLDNVGGQAIECEVKIFNNYNVATGLATSSMTVTECHGEAGADPTCITTPSSSNSAITSVIQCNTSGNGGGGTVTCSVDITNNIVGAAELTAATVNQCNSSGLEGGTQPTILCNPKGETTNATVTQCNTSGNGGGGTERVKCNVITSSTVSAVLPISVNQCIGSGNGGGALVTCSTNIQNIVTAQPTNPSNPTEPTNPSNPTEPTEPSQPNTPNTPIVPGQPNEPGNPPTGSDVPDENLAETGTETLPLLFTSGILMVFGIVLLTMKFRKRLIN